MIPRTWENEEDQAREAWCLDKWTKHQDALFYGQTGELAPFDGIVFHNGWMELVEVKGVTAGNWTDAHTCLIDVEVFYDLWTWADRLGCDHVTVLCPVIGKSQLWVTTYNVEPGPPSYDTIQLMRKGTEFLKDSFKVVMERQIV